MKQLSILLLIFAFITSCSQDSFEEYSNDLEVIFSELSFSDDLNLYVDETGQPADGQFTKNFQNGLLQADVMFLDGMISKGQIFRSDGLLIVDYITENDLLKHTYYNEEGEPRMIVIYGEDFSDRREFHVWGADGTRLVKSDQTIHKSWHENGQPALNIPWHDKGVHGVSTSWYTNGQKEFERHFYHGERHGSFKEWDEQGNLVAYKIYEMGELISEN